MKKDYMFVRERSEHGGSYYYTKGIGLTIDCKSEGIIGTMSSWELATPTATYKGITKEEFINKLHELWPDLKYHKDITKDKVVIYTDNIRKVIGFFEKYTTDRFEEFYVEIDNFFEIRDSNRWMDETTAQAIAEQAQKLIDELFIPEKYFYITPQQRNRKYIAKVRDDNTATKSYPVSFEDYQDLRKAYYSGLLYMPYLNTKNKKDKSYTIEEPMMILDITSSYIFDLLIMPHVVSEKRRQRNLDMWEYYLSSSTKVSIGLYEITYCAPMSYIKCFTNEDDEPLEEGEHTIFIHLTSIDLKNLIDLGYVKKVEPIYLYEYDIGQLPKYFLDAVVESYIAKVNAKDEQEKNRVKPILNGWYGECNRKYDDKEEFEKTRGTLAYNYRNNPALSPLWGILTTSYAKKFLLKLALKVDGWYYSDTDSIICKDTPKNRQLLKEFNDEIQAMVKEFCDKNGYDFEILKKLGTFKEEHKITKLKVWQCKTYCYKTVEGEVILKAAGLVKNNMVIDDSLFNCRELDYTKFIFPLIVPAKASSTGEGYYVEVTPINKAEYYALMKIIRKFNKKLSCRK